MARKSEAEERRKIEETGEVDISFKDEIYDALQKLNLSKSNKNVADAKRAKDKSEALLRSLQEEMARLVSAGAAGPKPAMNPGNGPGMAPGAGLNLPPGIGSPGGPTPPGEAPTGSEQDPRIAGGDKMANRVGRMASSYQTDPNPPKSGAQLSGGPSATQALGAAASMAKRASPLGAALNAMSSTEVAPGTLDPEKYPIAAGRTNEPADGTAVTEIGMPELAPAAGVDTSMTQGPSNASARASGTVPGRSAPMRARVAPGRSNGRMDATAEENMTKELNNQEANKKMISIQIAVPAGASEEKIAEFVKYIGGTGYSPYEDAGAKFREDEGKYGR